MFFFDYSLDVDDLRAEAERLVKGSDLRDGQVFKLQVVDSTETAIKVRVLMSAGDSGKSSDLAAFLRESLIAYVRGRYSTALPRSRQEAIAIARPDHAGEDRGPQSALPSPQ